MQNKIFNAIQKGLINALVFDDEETSISYQKSDINNKTEMMKVSLEELYDIFNDDKKSIFSYDTKNCLTLILDNGQEISLHEYEYKKVKNKPVFLKIFDDILKNGNNEIIIACDNNHYIPVNSLQWQNKVKQILPDNFLISNDQYAINNFNGYKTCQTIINIVENLPDLGNISAIKYCDNIESPLSFYKGYLPSIGQLNFILKYLYMINYIFNHLNYRYLQLKSGCWWSSTECSAHYAWYLDECDIARNIKISNAFNVLPLFTLKNK